MMWESFNSILCERGLNQFSIKNYDDVYKFNGTGVISTVKLKLINELIQIVRPTNMNVERVKMIIRNLQSTEKYIAKKNNDEDKYKKRWSSITG